MGSAKGEREAEGTMVWLEEEGRRKGKKEKPAIFGISPLQLPY
jgi:hypothetical protein